MKYLVFDITNILYRTFYAHKSDDDITIAGLAAHTALVTINKYFRNFKPHKIVMCFDRSNWRKEYTQSKQCISGKLYKGNRRKNMTPKEKEKYDLFLQHMADFEELIRKNTSIITLAGDLLEADDLVAGVVRVIDTQDSDAEFVIVSADKDLIQLLAYPNVRLIDPATGKDRTLDDWNGDAGYFMFEKCIRGDTGDNVQSALPRCRSTRIQKAYENEYERANLMMETWTDQTGKEYRVKDLFNENMLLMSLLMQPDDIQLHIIRTVLDGFENPGTFSYFHFLQYCGKFGLKKVADSAEQFTHMLS